MINGYDFSHHQNDAQIRVYLANNPGFIFHKASEGETYRDKECVRRVSSFPAQVVPGIYHYLRADKCSAVKEAANFLAVSCQLLRDHMLAIDVEYSRSTGGTADNDNHFAHFKIFTETLLGAGVDRLVVYIPDTYSRRWYQYIRENDLGLWIARYRTKQPEHISDFWQFTSKPVDTDVFYGSLDRLKSYYRR